MYLVHRINSEGLHTTTDKVEAMMRASIPKNMQELNSFLGLLNYYRKFLPNLASLLQPLNSLLQQRCNWKWIPECIKTFKASKDLILSAKVIAHFDPMMLP